MIRLPPIHRPWRPLLALLVLLLACGGHAPERGGALSAPVPGFHADFASFLERHWRPGGRLAYAEARADRADLDRYVARVGGVSPDSDPLGFPSEAERLAYWINAYNAWAIALVLDRYPIGSVRDLRTPILHWLLPAGAGFFYLENVQLGGRKTNLYKLENGLIRTRFLDPRVHFALNCASLGCPVLPRSVFTAAGLEAELERETERFLGDETKLEINAEERVIRISAIFDWYERDFTRWVERNRPDLPATLESWLLSHVSAQAASRLEACLDCRLEFVPYDWSLNDANSPPP